MFTFIEAIFAFLLARASWDFIMRRAKACKQSPLAWMVETTGLLAALVLVISPFIVAGLWLAWKAFR